MAKATVRELVQSSPRVTAQLNKLEGAAQRAHRLYLDHMQGCADCGYGRTQCTVAVGLWRTYTAARDGER
ncbi:hypothetical protein [Actinacidiphila glaucinigra]|uniref:hypothetical protein n=1 Tax=Actinacidiphila glaucinigra TaxID=235986 RepID=UPI0035E2DBFC